MAKSKIDPVELFAAAVAAHDNGNDIEGLRLLRAATGSRWPELWDAAYQTDVLEDRISISAWDWVFKRAA